MNFLKIFFTFNFWIFKARLVYLGCMIQLSMKLVLAQSDLKEMLVNKEIEESTECQVCSRMKYTWVKNRDLNDLRYVSCLSNAALEHTRNTHTSRSNNIHSIQPLNYEWIWINLKLFSIKHRFSRTSRIHGATRLAWRCWYWWSTRPERWKKISFSF